MRIIYMGTPEFAVPSLEKLIENNHEVVAVITAPDKPKGRGLKVQITPVKECAEKHQIPVLQPKNLKDPAFLEQLSSYKADLQIVVAFRMLPEVVWNMPPKGTFNLHSSLLPQYRGAAPIHWAIINGEKETGVTTFLLKHEIDTGNIILQEKEIIKKEDTTGLLYERLMVKGAELVLKTANLLKSGKPVLKEQKESSTLKHAPKIFPRDCEIDWSKTNVQVYNFIRGMNPWPGAWTTILGFKTKIHASQVLEESNCSSLKSEKIDNIYTDNKTFLEIETGKGRLNILEIQKEGKRKMNIKEFLAGNKL